MKTIMRRRAREWDDFLERIIKKREEKGMLPLLKKPELERLILHNFAIPELEADMVALPIKEREEVWMKA